MPRREVRHLGEMEEVTRSLGAASRPRCDHSGRRAASATFHAAVFTWSQARVSWVLKALLDEERGRVAPAAD